jgi:CRP-like cAMP-binding protein
MALFEKTEFLKMVPVFSSLDDHALSEIAEITHEKFYEKGNFILHEGEEGNNFYLIVTGRVKIFLETKSGKGIILKVLTPGDFFGEMALLDGKPRSATVSALDDTKVLSISRSDFTTLLSRVPDIAIQLLVTLCTRLRKANQQIEDLALLDANARIARLLLELAVDRGKRVDAGVAIDLRLTRNEIAGLAGMSRETASRILTNLQKRGLIRLEKGLLIIRDEETLKDVIIS